MRLILQRTLFIKLAAFITIAVAGISSASATLTNPVINGRLETTAVVSGAADQRMTGANRGGLPMTASTMHDGSATDADNSGTAASTKARDERSAAGTSLGVANVNTVPEPSTGAMLLMGLALICFASRHQHRNEKFSA